MKHVIIAINENIDYDINVFSSEIALNRWMKKNKLIFDTTYRACNDTEGYRITRAIPIVTSNDV